MKTRSRSLVMAAAGALAGALTNRAMQRTKAPAAQSAAYLVTAALAYPLSDPARARGPERSRELAAVGAFSLLGLTCALIAPGARRNVLAAGWLSHAAFDLAHDRAPTSRLPDWYPVFCAGFDAVVASRLVRGFPQ